MTAIEQTHLPARELPRAPTARLRQVRRPSRIARLALGIHGATLIGIVGVLLVYHGGAANDPLFAIGALLLITAVALFHALRARLVDQLELGAILRGQRPPEARQSAERDADQLLQLVSRAPNSAKLPPLLLD